QRPTGHRPSWPTCQGIARFPQGIRSGADAGRRGSRDDLRQDEAHARLCRQATMTERVTADHRATLERIFRHPESANIEWRQALSLLEAVGSVTEEHNGKVKITLGDETEVLRPPRDKDVDKATIVELRRMLSRAGLAP